MALKTNTWSDENIRVHYDFIVHQLTRKGKLWAVDSGNQLIWCHAYCTSMQQQKEWTLTDNGYLVLQVEFNNAEGVWHKASRQSDGSYRVTIKASEHKNSLGNYRADVYIVDNANQRHYVTETIVDVKHNKPVGTISVVNNNKDTGTFDVIISDVYSSKGVRTVQVPIWSEKDGQDDIRWYEATRQANGTYTVNVQATNHKNSTGLYNIHLYYILNDGSQVGVGGTTTTVEFRNAKTKTQTYITNVNSEAGSFTVVVDQAPQGRLRAHPHRRRAGDGPGDRPGWRRARSRLHPAFRRPHARRR